MTPAKLSYQCLSVWFLKRQVARYKSDRRFADTSKRCTFRQVGFLDKYYIQTSLSLTLDRRSSAGSFPSQVFTCPIITPVHLNFRTSLRIFTSNFRHFQMSYETWPHALPLAAQQVHFEKTQRATQCAGRWLPHGAHHAQTADGVVHDAPTCPYL
ncbi:unnamed protein product [Macrosiphum euphorbiae]|uniref:Uncharacterized protein n=1 Tax=Macrosiphum euphorbiae TaxID=13131 RepID=A0AAV0WM51_9HEMI|nr:unnamed protein product [Macrosiphum euphorbiae]